MRGDVATLSVDGRPWPVKAKGTPKKGYLHISGVGQGVRIHSIEIRDVEADWRPIFDGRSLDWMAGADRRSWRLEGGALVPLPGQSERFAAQSAADFGDGELRARFELTGPTRLLFFALRQSSHGHIRVNLGADVLSRLGPGVHEIRMGGRGNEMKGWLDGQPYPVQVHGQPQKGRIQFNCQGDGLRILSLDWRSLED